MGKKMLDIDLLRRMTEKGRQKVDKKESKERLTEDQKNDREAKKLSDSVISGLPARIKKEARRGQDSLDILLPSGYKLHDKVKGNISSWCWANELSVSTRKVRYSDDSPEEELLVISWLEKK